MKIQPTGLRYTGQAEGERQLEYWKFDPAVSALIANAREVDKVRVYQRGTPLVSSPAPGELDSAAQTVFVRSSALTYEEQALMWTYSHQLRVIRDEGSNRTFTSAHAAKLLSSVLWRPVSAANYRQMLARLRDKYPDLVLALETRVKYRLL